MRAGVWDRVGQGREGIQVRIGVEACEQTWRMGGGKDVGRGEEV